MSVLRRFALWRLVHAIENVRCAGGTGKRRCFDARVDVRYQFCVARCRLALDDNAFGLEAYRETGHGEHFLGTAHTLANYETVFYESTIADSNSYEQWEIEGRMDAERRAHDIWKKQLADYVAPDLDAAVDEELAAFVQNKKTAAPDMWY